jgi:hypothetical protein
MEGIIAFSAGAVHKVYDDIHDNQIELSSFHMELVKVLMVTLITILFLKSQSISILFLVIIGICLYLGNIDSDFWKACMPIPIITTVVNLDSPFSTSFTDIFQKIILFLLFSGVFIGEHKIFTEETSVRKTIFRSSLAVIVSILIYLTRGFVSYPFIKMFGLFVIGYIIANLTFHNVIKPSKALDTEKSNPDLQSHIES